MKTKVNMMVVTALLLIGCMFFSERFIIDHGQWFYAIHLLVVVILLLRKRENYIYFFSPSFMTLLYLNLSFALGHIVVSEAIGFDLKYYTAFLGFQSVKFITGFFILCNFMVFLAMNFKDFDKVIENRDDIKPQKISAVSKFKIYPLFVVLFLLGFVQIDLSLIGGGGEFSYVFKLVVAIIIILLVSDFKSKIKYLYYLGMIFIFVIGSFDSKREILYVIILILFFEFVRNRITIKMRFKQFVFFTLGLAFIFYLIVVSSIMRGYGNFGVDNPIDASKYVFKYITSDYAANALSANFELTSVYGNSSNAVNYVYSGQVDYLYGTTFIKFLFLPIPRSIFPEKPDSMIDIYTTKFSPDFRSGGGSYPIVIYAESFWNFSLLSLPFIFCIFYFFNKMYLKMIRYVMHIKVNVQSVFLIYMFSTLIQFIRGSGFEIWLVYGILSLPFSWLLISIFRLKNIN